VTAPLTIPGVYRRPQPRAASFPRLRTDVAGFVGFAGVRHLHRAVRVDDWRDFVEAFWRDDTGAPIDPPSGALLHEAVRAYFANGGARCYVVNVGPVPDTPAATRAAWRDLLGIDRVPPPTVDGVEVRRTGIELLLTEIDEVAFFAIPDLFASCTAPPPPDEPLPPVAERGVFAACPDRPLADAASPGASVPSPPCEVFTETEIADAQRYVIDRVAREPWRAFAILAVPPGRSAAQAAAWRAGLGEAHWAGIYWPWLRAQHTPGAPARSLPPDAFAAGIFARRDLARGPHIAPANEIALSVIGVEPAAARLDERRHADLYDRGVNVFFAFDGRGVELWGARTLLWRAGVEPVSAPLAYVSNRRCLSAIERTVERLGRRVAFEPHHPMLRLQLSHSILAYLVQVFRSGALAGEVPEQAFLVRCDDQLNPPAEVANGRLVCEIRVALTAPAEFIVFRVGRHEGVVEIDERGA